METKTESLTDLKNGKTNGATKKANDVKSATVENSTKNEAEIVKQQKAVTDILLPTAKGRLNRLETLNILAEKHKKASEKYDELTHFMASNDGNSGQMRFSSDSNYTFNVKNPVIINEILKVVEGKLHEVLTNTENEVLNFNI